MNGSNTYNITDALLFSYSDGGHVYPTRNFCKSPWNGWRVLDLIDQGNTLPNLCLSIERLLNTKVTRIYVVISNSTLNNELAEISGICAVNTLRPRQNGRYFIDYLNHLWIVYWHLYMRHSAAHIIEISVLFVRALQDIATDVHVNCIGWGYVFLRLGCVHRFTFSGSSV